MNMEVYWLYKEYKIKKYYLSFKRLRDALQGQRADTFCKLR